MYYLKSPLNYIGGKGKLLKDIIPILNSTNSKNFVDIEFAGGIKCWYQFNAKNNFTVKHLNIDYSNSSYNAKNGKSDEIIVYNF